MTEPAHELIAPADLAEAADENFVVHTTWAASHTAGMRVMDERGLVVVDSGLKCDTFNFVCRARLTTEDAARRAKEAIAHFDKVKRPFSWWVGPADRPSGLGDMLVDAGLQRDETELAMSAKLTALRDLDPAPGGLQIRRVRGAEELRQFARISAANWSPPDPDVLRYYNLTAGELLKDECPLWCYVGYLGDKPVATAELTVGGGLVGLYNISTVAAFRRRGFGTAMTLQPLIDARARGYRLAVLQAAPDGVGVYARVGFERFGDITEFKPPAANR